MELNNKKYWLLFYLISVTLTFLLMFLISTYLSVYLFLLGFWGMTVYFLLDIQSWIKLNMLVKFVTAIIINSVYMLYELNNYEPDQRSFEFIYNGVLVTHSPSPTTFKFLGVEEFGIIVWVTTLMILFYEPLKHIVKKT